MWPIRTDLNGHGFFGILIDCATGLTHSGFASFGESSIP
jgi:hypothetical protein